jgi:hypothetical protein
MTNWQTKYVDDGCLAEWAAKVECIARGSKIVEANLWSNLEKMGNVELLPNYAMADGGMCAKADGTVRNMANVVETLDVKAHAQTECVLLDVEVLPVETFALAVNIGVVEGVAEPLCYEKWFVNGVENGSCEVCGPVETYEDTVMMERDGRFACGDSHSCGWSSISDGVGVCCMFAAKEDSLTYCQYAFSWDGSKWFHWRVSGLCRSFGVSGKEACQSSGTCQLSTSKQKIVSGEQQFNLYSRKSIKKDWKTRKRKENKAVFVLSAIIILAAFHHLKIKGRVILLCLKS